MKAFSPALLTGVHYLSAGCDETCAVAGSAVATCWGDNEFGQVGDGTTVDRNEPMP